MDVPLLPPAAWEPGAPPRLEVTALAATTTNDVLLRAHYVGGSFHYRHDEVFGVEVQFGTDPFEVADPDSCDDRRWKPVVCDAIVPVSGGHVPVFSYLTHHAHIGLTLTPLHGTAWIYRAPTRIEGYARLGLGGAGVEEDDVCLSDEPCPGTAWYPSTDVALGARVAFSPVLALRFEMLEHAYVDASGGTTLEMKNTHIVQGGLSGTLGR